MSGHGGDHVADVLERHGVRFLFTLCGGHISPILVGAKARGIRVVDVRHEVTAVFAADAVARLTGVPGVAAVTAGPGVTNTITALKNAQMAQSPLVVLGGATATVLKGRGSLQDVDQMALVEPHVKWARSVSRVRDLAPALTEAFHVAASDVPGPVFLECPVDLLYGQELVCEWYGEKMGGKSLAGRALTWYLKRHLARVFADAQDDVTAQPLAVEQQQPSERSVDRAASLLAQAEKPVLVVGSQALADARRAESLARAIERLGLPVYLAGMARGLLGREHQLQYRHARSKALREADVVLLAGFPCDFRLGYGDSISRRAKVIAVNRSRHDLRLNRRPDLGVLADPSLFVEAVSEAVAATRAEERLGTWHGVLRERDEARDAAIAQQGEVATEHVNPVSLCRSIEDALADDSVLVADGGDFVATAAYTVRPRGPLRWLDPGVFGTLGVGAGFALGAKLCRPDAEIWLLYGDGSAGYSLAEFDTFARHDLPVIAVVGNDAAWMQIAREQVPVLGDDVGTALAHTDYEQAAIGFGGAGLLVKSPERVAETLAEAKRLAADGAPVLVNAWIGRSDFRKGSISM